MKGKIALGVLVIGGVMFAIGLYNYPGHDIYFPADPNTVWTSDPASKLDVTVNQSAMGEGGVITYYNQDNEVVLQTPFTGRVNIFAMDSKILYDAILAEMQESEDDDFVFDAHSFARSHGILGNVNIDTLGPIYGRPRRAFDPLSYMHYAGMYANDLMFRGMGGPEGSMDTSRKPILTALPAPDDD